MKNLKLIYLIPALMVLVWGCGQRPQTGTGNEEPQPQDTVLAYTATCPDVNQTIAKDLFNSTASHKVSLNISTLSSSQMLPNVTPLLTSDENGSNSLNMQTLFGISGFQPQSAELKYFASQKLMVIAINVSKGSSDRDFFVYGQSSMLSQGYNYQTGDVDAVVAIIKYPDAQNGDQYIFSVNQLNQCMNITPTDSGISSELLKPSEYQNYLTTFGEPYIFGRHDKNLSISHVDIAVPIDSGFVLNNIKYNPVQDADGNYKIFITADENTDNENNKKQLYTFSGNLMDTLSLSGILIEVEVIINLANSGFRRVKIRAQSTVEKIIGPSSQFRFINNRDE